MTLKRQIFLSFCSVAMVTLLVAVLALCWINFQLSINLYGNNLSNSVQIQTSILTENINRFLVNNSRLAGATAIREYLGGGEATDADILSYPGISDELIRFADETAEGLAGYAILGEAGTLLYASGSKSDVAIMKEVLSMITIGPEQSIEEIFWEEEVSSLAMVTPVLTKLGGEQIGTIVSVYSNDYFLKSISVHQQFGASNAFIYCAAHGQLIKAKHAINALAGLSVQPGGAADQDGRVKINGETSMVRYRPIPRTPWMLVNSVPLRQVYAHTSSYLLLGALVLIVGTLAALIMSRIQSRRVLQPLTQLLTGVERFLLSEENTIPALKLDKRSEIGYLADQFNGMAAGIAVAQRNLKESNYLYDAILRAAYYFRIYIDLAADEINASNEQLDAYLTALKPLCGPERAMAFFEKTVLPMTDGALTILRQMVTGEAAVPLSAEVCCKLWWESGERWLRVLSVPIVGAAAQAEKVVLHVQDITEKKREELRLKNDSQRDLHSGLLNKNAFTHFAQQALDEKPERYVIFFIDLDNFKQVNDFLGHAAGDEVLVEVSRKMSSAFRPADLVCRYGGDEFVVFALGMGLPEGEKKAAYLVEHLPLWRGAPDVAGGIHVSASIGLCAGSGAATLNDLLLRADQAMYWAKQKGKSQYAMWNEDIIK